MPHLQPLNPLDRLRDRLRSELDVHHAVHAIEWGNPRVMKEVLKQIRRDLAGDSKDRPAEDHLNLALQQFARNLIASSFTELKYICYGATVPVGRDQWRLIDRQPLFDAMLTQVREQSAKPKQFRRCFQGLLSAYFGFERNLEEPSDTDTRWLGLRGYLAQHLDPLRESTSRRGSVPEWLNTLSEHRNLLTADPCSRYAVGLARDDPTELKTVCAGLGIPNNSWVWDDALMAYVKLVCQSQDAAFKQRMGAVLSLVNGATSLTLPPALATRATALVVTRYAQCAEHPEHPVLRDTCVEWIGNPWLKRTAWDALVNHEPARLMVNSWLKQRLITDFFQLLAADGAADLRRLKYWLRWEPQITDMWFVLGSDAQANKTAEFLELRKRMSGRDRVLVDNNHLNNAFVMRIGPLLVIEFGVTGNACYVFAAADFRTNLDRRVLRLTELKQRSAATRLSHMSQWESRFDFELRRLLQATPASKGTFSFEIDAAAQAQPRVRPEQVWPSPSGIPSQTTISPGTPSTNLSTSSGGSFMAGSEVAAPRPTTNSAYKGLSTQPPWPKVPPRSEGPGSLVGLGAGSADAATRKASVSSSASSTGKGRISELELKRLQILLEKNSIEWMDNRSKGGNFWVFLPDRKTNATVTSVLDLYRFEFKDGKGFWLKNDQ